MSLLVVLGVITWLRFDTEQLAGGSTKEAESIMFHKKAVLTRNWNSLTQRFYFQTKLQRPTLIELRVCKLIYRLARIRSRAKGGSPKTLFLNQTILSVLVTHELNFLHPLSTITHHVHIPVKATHWLPRTHSLLQWTEHRYPPENRHLLHHWEYLGYFRRFLAVWDKSFISCVSLFSIPGNMPLQPRLSCLGNHDTLLQKTPSLCIVFFPNGCWT